MKGKMLYGVMRGDEIRKVIRLTVCCDDEDILESGMGLSELRRLRIRRLLREAADQGVRLTHGDLALILLTSKSTIKRDIQVLRNALAGRNRRPHDERRRTMAGA